MIQIIAAFSTGIAATSILFLGHMYATEGYGLHPALATLGAFIMFALCLWMGREDDNEV